MITTEFLRQLDRFSLVINKKVTSSFVGDRATERLGSGLVFSDYANYNYGDDFKNIDWKAYARTDKLFVKRYEEDRNLTVHLVIDYSGSMDFGTKIKKYEYASMVGLGFCYLALKNNERFVLATFDDTLDFFRPKKGMGQITSILGYLQDKKAKGQSSFQDSLIKYRQLIHSKSMVVIISDFFYDIEQIKTILFRYKKNHIVLVQVLDKLEKNLNIEGDFDLVDLESNSKLHTFIDPFMRKQYFKELEVHQARIRDACAEVKAHFYVVGTDESIFDVFYRILD
ncbi:DUF58 domain-containing protein [Candidatus Woesearchaeota archaeon]|nr:DUF58 domain-containing protein [Candidatus Woesearchaeota archaeon]